MLHALVDTYGSDAFGILHTIKTPEPGAFVLQEQALPFYRAQGLDVEAVLTDNGREFCGTEAHPYELILALNDIEHRRTPIGRPQPNGFVERFIRTAKEFFVPALKRKVYLASMNYKRISKTGWPATTPSDPTARSTIVHRLLRLLLVQPLATPARSLT